MAYFSNPRQAVRSIQTMLLAGEWDELSRYYDLQGTDAPDLDALTSGDFFVRKVRPETAHPASFWKYKHPFSPQFSYLSHKSLSDCVVEVIVQTEIDEGNNMTQRGRQAFYLIKSTDGYQLLPTSTPPPSSPSIDFSDSN